MSTSAGRFCSSYHAELVAIDTVLAAALETLDTPAPWPSLRICTDSQSAITTLSQGHPDVMDLTSDRIWKALHSLSDNNIPVHLQWVPGHAGLPGNEEVDSLAKRGTLLDQSQCPIDYASAVSRIERHVRNRWLYDVSRKSIEDPASSLAWHQEVTRGIPPDLRHPGLSRKESRLVEQLRMGKCPILQSTKADFGLVPDGTCPHCDSGHTESARHYLLSCVAWADIRFALWGPSPTPQSLFADELKILKFLKRTRRIDGEDGPGGPRAGN